MNQKSSLRDPLDELRSEEWPKLCSFSEWRNRLADAWQAERDEHEKSLSYATSRWKNACDNVEATAASQLMFVPLDADGVPCHIGDRVSDGDNIGEITELNCTFTDDCPAWTIGLDIEGYRHATFVETYPSTCHHVAPKPETIEDVRDEATTCADCREPIDLVNRAYECGKRDAKYASGGYVDSSVLGGDAS